MFHFPPFIQGTVSCSIQHSLCPDFFLNDSVTFIGRHGGNVSIGGRTFTNLRFTFSFAVLAQKQQGLSAVVENLDNICTRFEI